MDKNHQDKHKHEHDARAQRRRSALTGRASGSITNDQRSSSLCGTDLRLITRLTLVAAYSLRRRSCSSHERASDMGLAVSLISKM
jgi:hypothetical protein